MCRTELGGGEKTNYDCTLDEHSSRGRCPHSILPLFPIAVSFMTLVIPRFSSMSRQFLPLVLIAFATSFFVSQSVAQSPAGRWRGEWTSQSTGHRGPMRANIRPQSDGSYSARFSGRFFVVRSRFCFVTYRVDLVPTGWGSYVAEKKLGPVLGSYHMQTQFGSQSMSGSFQAAKDVGAVNMRRVGR